MSDKSGMDDKPTDRPHWKTVLTADERAKVRTIEFNSGKLREDLAKQSVMLAMIRNRAVQRVKAAEKAK